jgi:V8-like Glu-specific endopeptidase
MKIVNLILVAMLLAGSALIINSQSKDWGKYSPHVRLLDSESNSICSGTVVSSKYVITAAHCLTTHTNINNFNECMLAPFDMPNKKQFCEQHTQENDSSITISDANYKKTVNMRVVGFSSRYDLMVLEGDVRSFLTINLDKSYNAENKSNLISYGYPRGGKLNVSRGTSAGYCDFRLTSKDMNIIPGMSGGAVLNSTGDLIGVNYGVLQEIQLFNQILNIESLLRLGDL